MWNRFGCGGHRKSLFLTEGNTPLNRDSRVQKRYLARPISRVSFCRVGSDTSSCRLEDPVADATREEVAGGKLSSTLTNAEVPPLAGAAANVQIADHPLGTGP